MSGNNNAKKYVFDAKATTEKLVEWVKNYFETTASPETKAVIGISGGKDSSVAAAVCVKALGKDRVIGVLMPQGEQSDISYSHLLVDTLGIKSYVINVGDTVSTFMSELSKHMEPTNQAIVNTPARIRMTTLYAVAACFGGRVVNTCNLSEDWVGYSTKYGDAAGDFSPLSDLTVTEVLAVGDELGLPNELVHKVPTDGLCGKTDEENLGFTYAMLDKYIRGEDDLSSCPEIKEKIDRLHRLNLHKLMLMPKFEQNK
jgi:NAD+ synthase